MNYIFLFILGLAIGSFLNLLADRLPKGEDIFVKPSHCDFCKKRLSPKDLIPLLSFIMQKGKCRYCKKKLSVEYPLVELATGLGFVLIYSLLQNIALPSPGIISLIFLLAIYSILLVIFVSDIKYFIIPDEMIIAGVVLTIIYKLVYLQNDILPSLVSGLAAFLFFYFLYIITRGKGMGFGDVKLAFLMGLLLSFPGIVISFYIAFLTGAVIGIILILIGKAKFGKRIAFGPFLALSCFIVLLWKQKLVLYLVKYLFISNLQ